MAGSHFDPDMKRQFLTSGGAGQMGCFVRGGPGASRGSLRQSRDIARRVRAPRLLSNIEYEVRCFGRHGIHRTAHC